MKRLLTMLVVLSAVFTLAACRNTNEPAPDVTTDEFAMILNQLFAVEGTINLNSERMLQKIAVSESDYEDYIMRVPRGTNQDEYGVFSAADKDSAQRIYKAVQEYFENRRAEWMDEYLQDERHKLDAADVKLIADKYIVYVIADKDTVITAFTAAEALVKSKR